MKIKVGYILGLCFWAMPLVCMLEQMIDDLDLGDAEQIIKKMGGQTFCDKLLAQWSEYEKRLLVTVLNEPKWPSHRFGGPLYFSRSKEVYKDRIISSIESQKVIISIADFKILAELKHVPLLDSYHDQMVQFTNLREHFETEDETWEQLNRQLTRAK